VGGRSGSIMMPAWNRRALLAVARFAGYGGRSKTIVIASPCFSLRHAGTYL